MTSFLCPEADLGLSRVAAQHLVVDQQRLEPVLGRPGQRLQQPAQPGPGLGVAGAVGQVAAQVTDRPGLVRLPGRGVGGLGLLLGPAGLDQEGPGVALDLVAV